MKSSITTSAGLLLGVGAVLSVACSDPQQKGQAISKTAHIHEVVVPEEAGTHWSYSGPEGPDHWQELSTDFASCGCGINQSPIVIHPEGAKLINADLQLDYQPFHIDLLNDGHTIQEKVDAPCYAKFEHGVFKLSQFHFHTPSEHHIGADEYPMEIHFVHADTTGQLMVIAVMVEEGDRANTLLQQEEQLLPKEQRHEVMGDMLADAGQLMPDSKEYYHYHGSLTTPPCTEGVHWIIMRDPISASRQQIEHIHSIIGNDNRPTQPLNRRDVYLAE